MNTTRLRSPLLTALLGTTLASLSLLAQGDPNQPQNPNQDSSQYPNQDPPSRVARLALLQGNVSLEPAGVDTFSAAELNYPLTVGDRVYADNSSLTELQTSGLTIRLGNGADLTVTSLTDFAAQFGLAQGSVRLVTRDLAAPDFTAPDGSQALVEVDTPNGAIVVLSPGDIRVDSYPQDDTTVVTVTSGQVQITAAGQNGEYTETISQGQAIRLAGANPVYSQYVRPLPFDALDQFDAGRERQRQQSLAAAGPYADSGMVGLSDLGQYGDWTPDQQYGQVWYPRAIPANWTPYSVGHWAWVAPWGWTWVDAEPWGFAPFHYGRWAQFDGGRWGWVPGPPPQVLDPGFNGHARPIRAVYSPALVAFVGGPRFSLSIGFGGGSGSGVTAWFPLGPHEAYQPWYHSSPGYVNRVNVTNIYNRNSTEVHNTYINRTTNVYNIQNTNQGSNTTYVNRQAATVAVSQHDFADGRRIADSQRVENDPRARQALNQAPILPHPLVTPQRGTAAPAAPPRAVPPSENRPVLTTRQGLDTRQPGTQPTNTQPTNTQPTNTQPGNRGFQPGGNSQPGNQPGRNQPGSTYTSNPAQFGQDRQPIQPVQTPPQRIDPRNTAPAQTPAIPGRGPVAVPAVPDATPQPLRGGFPAQRDHQPVTSLAPAAAHPAPTQPVDRNARPVLAPQQPVTRSAPVPSPVPTPGDRRAPLQQTAPVAIQPQPAAPVRLAPRPPDQPRELVNRNPPQQPAQPPFNQQQRAIERTDPGRPLSPQQVQSLRTNQPVAPATQPEAHPHPPAAPAPAPAKPGTPPPANVHDNHRNPPQPPQ